MSSLTEIAALVVAQGHFVASYQGFHYIWRGLASAVHRFLDGITTGAGQGAETEGRHG